MAIHRTLKQTLYFGEPLISTNLIDVFAKRISLGHEKLGNRTVSSLVMKTIKMEGMSRNSYSGALLAGDNRHVSYMGNLIRGITTDEDLIRVAELSSFGNYLVDFRIIYGAQLLIVLLVNPCS